MQFGISNVVKIIFFVLWISIHGISGVYCDQKTNVIFIMADDIGYECYQSYGGQSYKTPVLNRLASKGMRFNHAYSNPICTPTRVKAMTGLRNVRNYAGFGILRRSEKTFGHMMQGAGYKTIVAGKWQLFGAEHYKEKFKAKGTLPEKAGFDRHCLWQVEKLGNRFWGPTIRIDGQTKNFGKETYGPDVYCQFLLDRMEEYKDKPFFIYYPMALVHSPFVPTPDSSDRNSKDKQRNFADMVYYMDKLIGKIVSKTEELGIAERTLILVTGDNGTHTTIKSLMENTIVQGGKGKTTDAGTRVGFFAYQPGNVPPGTVMDDLIEFSDILPTIADATGIKNTMPTDGRSFYPQLKGLEGNPRDSIYIYYWPRPEKGEPKAFVRNKRWKLYQTGEIYDLSNDIMEKNSISSQEVSDPIIQSLAKSLNQMPARGQSILNFD